MVSPEAVSAVEFFLGSVIFAAVAHLGVRAANRNLMSNLSERRKVTREMHDNFPPKLEPILPENANRPAGFPPMNADGTKVPGVDYDAYK